ncbi:MAG: DCC1-like thiol-disulfide oxidoreductase family protein [Microcystaceae cyanobacterium]
MKSQMNRPSSPPDNKPSSSHETGFIKQLKETIAFDRRALALFRMALALVIMADLISRARSLTAHYTDQGVLPTAVVTQNLLPSGYWSVHLLNGSTGWQIFLFGFALFISVLFLMGCRTRLATIVLWALTVSLQNRNPALHFAGDAVLRAILFWSMFLPLGSCYSVDSALNNASEPLPKRIISAATFAFMVQVAYIYMWSAAFKLKSPLWFPDGDAVWYSLQYDQYGRSFGAWLLTFPQELLRLMTHSTLLFEWLGPLLIFIPFWQFGFRSIAIVSFISLHAIFGLTFEIGIFSYLSIAIWLIFIPSEIWDRLENRISTPSREGLTIYYDADCGFCKKVVHFIRTLAILPATPLLTAQSQAEIYEEMQEINSWVVVGYDGQHYHKFEAIAYVCSISPVLFPLAPLFRWKPIMRVGTRFYEMVASNRKTAGLFTRPFKFRPILIRHSFLMTGIVLILLFLTSLWNLRSYVTQTFTRRKEQPKDWITMTDKLFKRRTFQRINILGRVTRLDQYWSIFAPGPPADDGWHVIVGQLKDGSEVNLLQEDKAVTWDKLSIKDRYEIYPNMQWRVFFTNLPRSMGKVLLPEYADYLCRRWNRNHSGEQQLEQLSVYFMDERTAPPDQIQTVEKTKNITHTCN